MIKLTKVSKEYPKRGFALRDISFHLKKGEFAFLTGHSGSGKSTTMRLIHMADRPSDGEVRVTGYSSAQIPERDLWKVRRRVGFVFQDFRLLPGRTAMENVAFVLEVTGTAPAAVQERAQRLLTKVGLSRKMGAFVNELSGGEQQRVAIARALANDPYVLLADEPTGNLDERATRGVMDLFWDINAQGMAVLMATHDLELLRRHPNARVFELDEGRLVYDSANDQVRTAATAAGGVAPNPSGGLAPNPSGESTNASADSRNASAGSTNPPSGSPGTAAVPTSPTDGGAG